MEGSDDRPGMNHKLASQDDRIIMLEELNTKISSLPADGDVLNFGKTYGKVIYKTAVNLNGDTTKDYAHGLSFSKILGVKYGWVLNDAGTVKYNIPSGVGSGGGDTSSAVSFGTTNIFFVFGASFSSADFDAAEIFCIIEYME